MLGEKQVFTNSDRYQVDLSGKEEVYKLMGYSVFSSKAFIFYKKCQICYLSGKVALKDKNSDRSGNNLNSKFTRGFLALDCQALAACCFIYSEKATKFFEKISNYIFILRKPLTLFLELIFAINGT